MSLNLFKDINVVTIFLLLFIAIFLGVNMNPVSAATINVSSGLQNYDIQTLIDGAQAGDTINFAGNSYSNISLIINKKLNIISLINTVINSSDSTGINGSSMGLTETFAFYFTKNSSGSVISGFNILTNSDYGIIAENVKNITISSNNISGGYKGSIKLNNVSNTTVSKNNLSNSNGNGVDIENSKKIAINGNQISNNTYSGINVYKSNDINLTRNEVSNNGNGVYIDNSKKVSVIGNQILNNNVSGMNISSSENVSVKNNKINKNGHGIYLSDTNRVNVSYNEISKNQLNGITMEGTTQNTYFSWNNITGNLNGFYIDSKSINDTLLFNIIANSTKNPHTYLGRYNDGNGIDIGDNYQESDSPINIEDNSITGNGRFSIKSSPLLGTLIVGDNYFGPDNELCPMVCAIMLPYDPTIITSSDKPSNPNNPNNPHNNGKGGNTTGYTGGNGNGSFLGNGSGNANGNGNGSGIGLFGTLTSNEPSGGSSGGGQNPVEVSVKNTINSIKNNPYTSLAVLALIALVAVGYFRRDKSN